MLPLNCIDAAATLIVTLIVAGLPATVLPVNVSVALTVMLVVKVVPVLAPVALTSTLTVVVVPAARPVPEVVASETMAGALGSRAAVQSRGSPPELVIVNGWVVVLLVTLNVNAEELTLSDGGATTVSVTEIVCGPPLKARPWLSTPTIEMVSLSLPVGSFAEVTFTLKVALPPVITAEAGVTVNQLLVTVGVMVILPVQGPMMPIVKRCAEGLEPASLLKVSLVTDGAWSVQGGCTTSVTITFCGEPTA